MDGTDDHATYRAALQDAQRKLAQRLAVQPRALSSDGHAFRFVAAVASDLPIGGYVRIETAEDIAYLGQITEKTLVECEGPELSIAGDAGLGAEIGSVRVAETRFRVQRHQVSGSGLLLGRQTAAGIAVPTAADVFEDAEIAPAEPAFVAHYLHDRLRGRTALDIGTLGFGGGSERAALLAAGFDRHTFLCGQSGSGKTYSLGVILERLLLETDLRLVIIDPNSDFVHLAAVRPRTDGALGERYRAAAAGVRVLRHVRHGSRAADPLHVRFSDLPPVIQGMVLQLDPLADREEFGTFRRTVARLGDRPYSLADVQEAATDDLSADARNLALRIANLGVADWDIWGAAEEPSLASLTTMDWRAAVLDIGGFDHPAEKSLVALATLDYLWRQREERSPMLVVIDEAHTICPQLANDSIQATATERVIQIAGEGRKFGLYLLLSTQRPQKLHANVVSQCDNLVLMRMNSAADLAHLATVFSFVPPSLLAAASSFAQGETLVAGKIVPTPLLVRFGDRISEEGGSDVPATWARPPSPTP